MKRQRSQPEASEDTLRGGVGGAKAAAGAPQFLARKRPAPFCPPLVRASPAASAAPALASVNAIAAKAPAAAPAATPSPTLAAQPAGSDSRAPAVSGLRRPLGTPRVVQAQSLALPAATQPRLQSEATMGGSSSRGLARKTPAPRPKPAVPAPTPDMAPTAAAVKPPRGAVAATASVGAEEPAPTHMVGAGTGAAGGAGGAGSTQALGAGAMKQLDAVTSTDSASGSGAAGPTEPSPGHPGGAVDDSSRNPASALPDADATGASAGGQATPQPAATSRRLRTAGEAGPPDADIVSAPTPSPTPTIEAAATGSNAADTSADAGETAAAAAAAPAVAAPAPAAQAPPLSPSPAPALLRAVRSPLQRERASAPAPAVPADPSPLPQRASPCASGSRSGIAPSSSATTEQEQLRLAEQLPSLLTPMLALDEAPQPQWASPPPPPALQQQERQEQAQEHDAHGAAPRQRAPGGEAAPAAPGTAATAPRAAAAAARSADRAAVAEEVVISRLPMKEQVPHEPRPLGSAFASSPFSQLMGALPVARLLAPTPPSNPLQLRLASAAAARNVQGALRPRRAAALAVHTPPQARSSPSCGPPTSASTAEAAGAAVQPLLSRGARAGISADDGATRSAGAGAGGGGGGGACMIAGGRGQHLRQAVRLARILATFRGNTLRAFRPAAAPLARSLQAAAAPELSSTDTNGDGPAGAAGEGVPPGAARSDPSGSGAPAAWAPGLAPADGAAAGAAMRTGSTPGEAEGIRWQAVREPTALEAWPPESQELKRPPKPAAALPTQHDGDPVAASCKAGLDVQDSAAERARSGGQQCVSAAVAVAGDGAVEMESACAESGGGVVEGGRRPGTAMLSVAGSEVVDGGGNSWGEQRTAWGGLSLAFLADVFNSAQ